MSGLLTTQNNRVDSVIIGDYTFKGTLGIMRGGAELADFDFLDTPTPPVTHATASVTNPPAPAPATPTPAPSGQVTPAKDGGAIIICKAPGEYYISGKNISISVTAKDKRTSQDADFLALEEGIFSGTDWIPTRCLNGDEFMLSLAAGKSKIYKVSLYNY
jgi:hypothetical protein